MAKNKPEYKVTKHSGTEGSDQITGWGKRSTVSRTNTLDAAQERQQDHRTVQERGSSDWFTVEKIQHRERNSGTNTQ